MDSDLDHKSLAEAPDAVPIGDIAPGTSVAHYYIMKGDGRKALAIHDSIKQYYRMRFHRTDMHFNALLYISLLKQAGRKAEAESLETSIAAWDL